MNHVVWHTSSHQPPESGKPGWVYYAGTHITPNITWWPMARPFLDYLARASFLLRQGIPVSDVLHYYGDQGYNFVTPKHVDPSLGYGFDYDVTNADALLRRMNSKNGRITLPEDGSYSLLTLPDRTDMDLDVLRKLATLVKQGATVVGRKPKRSTGYSGYPDRDRLVQELAGRLWGVSSASSGEHPFGKGRVIWGRPLRQILTGMNIKPDLQFSNHQSDLDFVQRRLIKEDTDIYFLRNKSNKWLEGEAKFRITGRQPEIWLADSGSIEPLTNYAIDSDGTRVKAWNPPDRSSSYSATRRRSRNLPLPLSPSKPSPSVVPGTCISQRTWARRPQPLSQLSPPEPITKSKELSITQASPNTISKSPCPTDG